MKGKDKGAFSVILGLALVALIGYFIFSSAGLRKEREKREREAANLAAAVSFEDEKKSELSDILNGENESEYMERYAREKLDYVMPDERVYADSGK